MEVEGRKKEVRCKWGQFQFCCLSKHPLEHLCLAGAFFTDLGRMHFFFAPMRVFDLRSTLQTHLGGQGLHSKLWMFQFLEVPTLAGNSMGNRRRCSRRFFVESEFGDHIVADDFHIKSSHCRLFLLNISANARHWILTIFPMLMTTQQAKFHLPLQAFYLAGLPAHIAPGEKSFCRSKARTFRNTFYSSSFYYNYLLPGQFGPYVMDFPKNLSPRDASLFAKYLPFCAATSCCFGSPAPLDICPHFACHNFKMMDRRGCTFEGATRADHQTLLLEHHPFERKKSGRDALCT